MFKITNEYLDLDQIADSGQVFRWRKLEDGYLLIATDKAVVATQEGNEITVFFDGEEEYWKNYLDLLTDYRQIIESIDPKDEYLTQAAKIGKGIRILRQDFFEMLVSFIISQNNNIPRIKKTIEGLCEGFGTKKQIGDDIWFLAGFGLGYRQRYLEKLISDGVDVKYFKSLDFIEAKKQLKSIVGVGEKVACCVALFGLHHLEAFPIDTWMKKIQNEIYHGSFDLKRYGKYAGVLQQYMFYYARIGGNRG